MLIRGIARIYKGTLLALNVPQNECDNIYIVLLELNKNSCINSKSEFLYAFMYLDTELQCRLPSKVAVLLKVSVVCFERMCSRIQGSNNTARDLGIY